MLIMAFRIQSVHPMFALRSEPREEIGPTPRTLDRSAPE